MCIAKDITEQKNAELIALKAMITGQDLERKRLASDLHDSLGQELNAIKLYLGTLEILESNTPEYKKCINEINRMFNDTINSVREITFDLMPFILENNSISSAIEQLCKQLNSIHTIRINYISNVKKIGLKDKKDEAIVYRIIQEFINNSLKHSKATVINVELSKNKNEIKIQLNDNGVGFDLKKVARNNGLRNIQQRLEILNAEFHFVSQPNSATNLNFTIYE
jgi:signal transduction histidine kinase